MCRCMICTTKSDLTDGERSSVVRASEIRYEDPGFDPLVGQAGGQCFCSSESSLVQSCLCLTLLLLVYGTHPHFVRMLMILYPSVEKE